jgi:serine-type D-Ala-D-Ala carboxypeptidase/endopeptidase (penicillin-binding protein 4)
VASVALVAWACGLGAYGLSRLSQPAPAAGLELAQVTPPGPVLPPLQAGGHSDHAGVATHLAGVLRARALGPHVGVAVDDLDSGKALLRLRGRDVFTPASTVKLLTTTAALEVLGPDHRFTTSTVLAGRTVFLVGGGDPLLARRAPPPDEASETYPLPATVANLASKTARKLHERGVREVRVAADASLFSGSSTSPTWEPSYVPSDVVSPISALWVDEGRVRAGFAERSTDPVAAAAAAFVGGLRRHGITVRGDAAVAAAPPDAAALAQVDSAPLARIVEHILELSDNEGAEVLLRQTAVGARLPASFSGGVEAVHQTLTKLGVDLSSATIHDGSGLSRDDALRLSTLARVLETAADPAHPELRAVVSGLPVAGFSGTLAYRFVDPGTSASLGVVRAKTGTLTGVTVYAGITQARDGDLLAFVADADRVRPVDTLRARTALDRIASSLATCGC